MVIIRERSDCQVQAGPHEDYIHAKISECSFCEFYPFTRLSLTANCNAGVGEKENGKLHSKYATVLGTSKLAFTGSYNYFQFVNINNL
jgi:hypothetical protein